MKQIVADRDDIAFYIKLLPLKIHPAAYKKAKAIVCERSLRLLDRAFDGRALPSPSCETAEVDDNIELAERLGITGTPTIVLPDGGVINGYRDSVPLQKAIEAAGLAAEEKERQELLKEQEKEEQKNQTDEQIEEQDSTDEQEMEQTPAMEEEPGNGSEGSLDEAPAEGNVPSAVNAPTQEPVPQNSY
jgi:hypothetical protein